MRGLVTPSAPRAEIQSIATAGRIDQHTSMRTTLNLDDELLARMTQRFPPGTPKTVIIEESLRRALAEPPRGMRAPLPDEVAALVARGILVPPARTGVPPQTELDPLPSGALLRDLTRDRDER